MGTGIFLMEHSIFSYLAKNHTVDLEIIMVSRPTTYIIFIYYLYYYGTSLYMSLIYEEISRVEFW